MPGSADRPLLIGEISIDFTLTEQGQENKLRLGGIVHAARGFWAEGRTFDAAVVLPSYLIGEAEKYLREFGCQDFQVIGLVNSAPNVTVIQDATEVADQGYDTLLRDAKYVEMSSDSRRFDNKQVLIFPGDFDFRDACSWTREDAVIHADVAYDLTDLSLLADVGRSIGTIFLSTSSKLFVRLMEGGSENLVQAAKNTGASHFVLKENRGGSRLFDLNTGNEIRLAAQLGVTVNSVGVGDVFAASFVHHLPTGSMDAGWRATYAATAYSQTTFPKDFRDTVQQNLSLCTGELADLGGVCLPWERRRDYPIYLAAPDFSYVDRTEIFRALDSLEYHNFVVRRPVLENGEVPPDPGYGQLKAAFNADCRLLKECSIVFAIPLGRDPGTLVEMGMAMQVGTPVITYDPWKEANNTMVVAGSRTYSQSIDECLNAVFTALSQRDQA